MTGHHAIINDDDLPKPLQSQYPRVKVLVPDINLQILRILRGHGVVEWVPALSNGQILFLAVFVDFYFSIVDILGNVLLIELRNLSEVLDLFKEEQSGEYIVFIQNEKGRGVRSIPC